MKGRLLTSILALLILTRTHLKNSLSAHGGVMQRLKMLTYYLYAPRFRRCMPCPEP